jgi:hypothetical protein
MEMTLKMCAGRGASALSSLRRIGRFFALLLLLPGAWACQDDPFKINWELAPDTVLLYSLARPEMNLSSAFDFVGRTTVRVEAPSAVGEWDLAVDTQNGGLVFVPPGAIGVTGSTARIAPMGDMPYDEIRKAPRDTTLYIGDRVVPVEVGQLYVIRTRQKIGSWGTRCVYYGKMEPLSADPETGILTFQYDVSPVCNDRKLIPPKG